MKKKLNQQYTPWFSGDIKPKRPGFYQRRVFRRLPGQARRIVYAHWDGHKWSGYCTKDSLHIPGIDTTTSTFQCERHCLWRGLAKPYVYPS